MRIINKKKNNKKMEHSPLTRRYPPTPTPPSLRRTRSRSGAENHSTSTNNSRRFNTRSKSTTSSRNILNEVNINPSSSLQKKKPTAASNQEERCTRSSDGFVRFLRRSSSPSNSQSINYKRPRSSASKSPSAWALSPGRSNLFNMFPPELPAAVVNGERGRKVKGGGMSGVLKYFRQKKVSPTQEEQYHKFRVLNNRLLQWRFANARAEASMASVKIIAEDGLFHVWIRIINVRNIILEKKIQIKKLKLKIKLCQILNPQINTLNEWGKIEKKNCEAMGRMTTKLSAFSLKLPLEEEAKGDVESVYKAMSTAVEVMDSIEATITTFHSEVEKKLYLLTELTTTIEYQKESLVEMERVVTLITELLAWEKSIRVQLLQVVKESGNEKDF